MISWRGWLPMGAASFAASVLAAFSALSEGVDVIRVIGAVGAGIIPFVVYSIVHRNILDGKSLPSTRDVKSLSSPVAVEPRNGETRQEIKPVPRRVIYDSILDNVNRLDELIDQIPRTKQLDKIRERIESFLAEFRESSQFIYENVIRTFEISDNLANTAKEAFELSEKVQSGVKIVTESLNESQKLAEALFAQSRKISKIVTIMSDISEKIHILSINASIVSARAGMSGKGFDVVAKEIRNLAKETENSLFDIENVIAEVQNTIQNVTDKVNLAHKETETEKGALLAVAGSLQGVILAVEIIRAVSSVAKERGEYQVESLNKPILSDELLDQGDSNILLEQVRSGVIELEQLLVQTKEEER